MQAIQYQSTNTQYVISIDKNLMDRDELFEVLRWLRLRFLIRKAEFEPEIEDVGEEILSEWWSKNHQRYVPVEA